MRLFTIFALALAVGLASAASPFASSHPDGLERVAEDQAFLARGTQQGAPVPDYAVPGVGNERVATGLAGFAGVLGVFAIGYGVAVVARRRPLPA
jgi:hypothetical protein